MPDSPPTITPSSARPTMADIAAACGVSKGTVSLALNRPADDCPLRDDTRQRVLKEANRLGYRVNWRGRMLAGKRSQCAAMLYGRAAPFPQEFRRLSMIAEALQKREHDLMLVPALEDSDQWGQRLMDYRVDGCLVSHPQPPGLDKFAAQSNLPMVMLNLKSELDAPQILFDDYGGAVQVTRHLVELGHRKIVFYVPASVLNIEHYSTPDRMRGYTDVMNDAGYASHVEVWADHHPELCDKFCGMPADERPTAILGYAQDWTMGLVKSLWDRGIRVPDDLSVAAFNDNANGHLMTPSLTSVALPWDQLAELSADYLVNMLEGSAKKPPRVTTLSEQLVVRQSTAPLNQ